MNKELCLVTGATGCVGPVLVGHLLNAGYEVRALVRGTAPPGVLPPSVELCCGDISDGDFVRRAVQGAKLVFHLAAKLHVTNPRPELHSEFWQVNVEGTRNVVKACCAAGVQRLVFFSTSSVYGATQGAYVDEDTPVRLESFYAETKREAEEVTLAARNSTSAAPLGVVLRLAAIYGQRMKGNYPRLARALWRGLFLPVGDGRNQRTLVYEQDAARAAVLAAQHPRALGRIYNVSDGRIHSQREIIRVICAAIGRPPPRFFLPTRPARWAATTADSLAGLVGRSLNLATMVDKFVEDMAVRAERIQHELDFQPLFDLEEGWRQTVAAWQAAGNWPEGLSE